MSTQEFDQQDKQVIDVVNSHAAPETVKKEEEIASRACLQKYESRRIKRYIARKVAAVLACAAVAVALVAVMLQPDLLIWLVIIGLLSCAVVAGITIDRWWRK